MFEEKAKTLDEKQQRRSLSGGKNAKSFNRSIRNVLAKPYDVFWPLADLNDESELLKLLESVFPAARKPITAEDRVQLRKLQGSRMKADRTALTQEIWNRNPGSKDLRNCLAIGVNDVSRGLEENELVSILISNEANPPTLTKHLATLAATRNVPHIVLQNLKDYTKKTLDFTALTVGFKKIVATNSEHHFYPIHEKIENVFKHTVESLSLSTKADQDFPSIVLEHSASLESKKTFRNPQEIYLTRSSKSKRAFVPGMNAGGRSDPSWPQFISFGDGNKEGQPVPTCKAPREVLGSTVVADTRSFLQKVRDAKKGVVQISSQTVNTDSFLSLGVESDPNGADDEAGSNEQKPKNKPTQRYFTSLAPLKVKRIQGNPSKAKKKQKGNQK
ncbi:hypothetical protein ONE63_002432 [Megalurothrips usitatus]|uniref:Ribosomal protein eL8/eL30/eS12/Gadd45 domain-containing protein n=1 Tax=Megalurothrips usitatus TaxID=439358 RepID=A0AAV7XBW1_9NEOP|nr:hypothetical protein ONE63_002432 [Megalurothrips usitatus]